MSDEKHWQTYRFDEMAVLANDRIDDPSTADVDHYVGLEHLDSDSLTIRRWGSPSDVEATKLRFRAGDIIFGRRRVYQRKVAVAPFDGICSAHAMVLRAKPDVVLQEFLAYFMASDVFMDRAKQISVGSLSPTINWKSLANEEFALPPREEQWRIVQVAAAMGAARDGLAKLGEATLRLQESALEAAFDPVSAQNALADGQGGGGAWLRLGSIAELQPGYAFKSAEFSATGDRLLRGSNVAVDRTNWTQEETRHFPSHRRKEFSQYVLAEGDVIVAMDRPFVGDGFKVARLTQADLPSLLLQRVGRFLAPDRDTGDLVWAFVHSRSFQLQLLAQQEGTDLPHVSKSQIDGTLVPRDAVERHEIGPLFAAVFADRMRLSRRLRDLAVLQSTFVEEAVG